MNKNIRVVIAILIILAASVLMLGVDFFRRQAAAVPIETNTALPPGSVPIYYNGRLVGGFSSENLESLEEVSFVDSEEGKTQDGWLLRDVILLTLTEDQFRPESEIIISSLSRNKSVALYWQEINDPKNVVMFDLSNRSTVKLVSLLPQLDTRDEWIQDVDKIEITNP